MTSEGNYWKVINIHQFSAFTLFPIMYKTIFAYDNNSIQKIIPNWVATVNCLKSALRS